MRKWVGFHSTTLRIPSLSSSPSTPLSLLALSSPPSTSSPPFIPQTPPLGSPPPPPPPLHHLSFVRFLYLNSRGKFQFEYVFVFPDWDNRTGGD